VARNLTLLHCVLVLAEKLILKNADFEFHEDLTQIDILILPTSFVFCKMKNSLLFFSSHADYTTRNDRFL
jgi:hypothetical protein